MTQEVEYPAANESAVEVQTGQVQEESNSPIPDDLKLAEDNANGHELPASLFVSHMATYPAVAATVGFVASFPVVKIFASNAVPLTMAWRKRNQGQALKRLRPIAERADKFGDNVLNSVDKRFPRLKTAQPDEVMEMAKVPVKNARRTASVYGTAVHGFVSNRVVKSAKKVTHTARSGYTRIYDNNGKPILRSRLDPMILPLNNRAEEFIIDHVPEHRSLINEPVTNELSRSWRIGKAAAKKARPVMRRQFYTVTRLPGDTRNHVVKVYTTRAARYQKDGQAQTNRARILATLGTIKQLSQEGTSLLRKRLNSQQNGSNKELEDITNGMERLPREERDAVDELVQYLRNGPHSNSVDEADSNTLGLGIENEQVFIDDTYSTTDGIGTDAAPSLFDGEREIPSQRRGQFV